MSNIDDNEIASCCGTVDVEGALVLDVERSIRPDETMEDFLKRVNHLLA